MVSINILIANMKLSRFMVRLLNEASSRTERRIFEMSESNQINQPSRHLSPRQKEVVGYLARGLSVKEIAEIIGIRFGTVEMYIRRIKKRIGARSAAHCVALAIARGEITMDAALDTPLNQRPNGGNGDEQNE